MDQSKYDEARTRMWCELIPFYRELTSEEKKKQKRAYVARMGKTLISEVENLECRRIKLGMYNTMQDGINLAPLPTSTFTEICEEDARYTYKMSPLKFTFLGDEEEEEYKMYTDIANTRSYLTNRARATCCELDSRLRKKFYLDSNEPKSMLEAVERIRKGEITFTVTDEALKVDWPRYNSYDLIGLMSWNTQKPDYDGFAVAEAELKKAYTAVLDDVAVLPPEEALKSLRAFESMSFD